MRRKAGGLLESEQALLHAALDLKRSGQDDFYGFSIAKVLQDRQGARRLVSHGTLYKALDRLEKAGMLQSAWEDPVAAAQEGRPRRRLYSITAAGARAATSPQPYRTGSAAAETLA